MAGGRWNPPDVCCVVYGALNPEVPLKETMAYCARFNLSLHKKLPRQLAAIQVELQGVLDLTQNAVLQALQVTEAQLCHEKWWVKQLAGDESCTQAIGRAAFELGLQGILVPCSPAPGEINLVAFPDHLGSGVLKSPPD